MIETGEILQTMRMIQEENFDIRTITLGINLLDCSDPDPKRCADRVYDKICRVASNLVHTGPVKPWNLSWGSRLSTNASA